MNDRLIKARLTGAAISLALAALPPCAAGYDAFRIMTFNICHCATNYSLSVSDEDVRRAADVIAAQRPDFICLQEVDKETARSAGIDQTARIAELLEEATGERHYGTFGKGRDYQGGEFGVAILSKAEPFSVSTVSIAGSEPRALLVCEFADFYVATVHLDTNRDYRTNSIPVIREALAALPKPVFVTGDWNATPATDATIPMMREFLTIVSPTNDISTFTPRDYTGNYVIDYIAVGSGDASRFAVQRAWSVPNTGADGLASSDHNPVLVDLVLRPGAETLSWIQEDAVATGMTGTWSATVGYDPGSWKAKLLGNRTFSPFTPSRGNLVTNVVTAEFGIDRCNIVPEPDVQAALRLGPGGCFQVWTKTGGQEPDSQPSESRAWADVSAPGVAPVDGAEYTFRVVIDYVAQRYTVEFLDAEGVPHRCSAVNGGALPERTSRFPLAASGRCVRAVGFIGETTFTYLLGTLGSRPWPAMLLGR